MRRSSLLLVVGAIVVPGLLSCGDDVTEPVPEITGVTVTPSSVDMVAGESADVSAEVSTANGVQGVTLEWSSSNTSVATVGAAGEGTATVTGVSAGSAEITATATATNVDGSTSGTAGVQVQEPEPATVEDLTLESEEDEPLKGPASGEVQITVGVDAGDEEVSAVELLVDGEVVLTKDVDDEGGSGVAGTAARQQVVEDVVFNFRTDRLEGSTPDNVITSDNVEVDGTVSRGQFENGEHTISARLTTAAGPVRSATNTEIVDFDNENEFLADLSVSGGGQVVSSGGVNWYRGDLKVEVEPVIFDGGTSVGSVTLDASAGTQTDRASGDLVIDPSTLDGEPFVTTIPYDENRGRIEDAPGEPDGRGGFGSDILVEDILDPDGESIRDEFVTESFFDVFFDMTAPEAGPDAAVTAAGSEIQPETFYTSGALAVKDVSDPGSGLGENPYAFELIPGDGGGSVRDRSPERRSRSPAGTLPAPPRRVGRRGRKPRGSECHPGAPTRRHRPDPGGHRSPVRPERRAAAHLRRRHPHHGR